MLPVKIEKTDFFLLKLFGVSILFFLLFICGLFVYSSFRMQSNIYAGKDNILIFAPHPDDGVIMAGGYAILTVKNGGTVDIAFMTGSKARLTEAKKAWGVIGVQSHHLIPLQFDDRTNLTLNNKTEKILKIQQVIKNIAPDIIFIPVYEGGHFDHDITNYLVSSAVKSMGFKKRVFESPEYNYYFSIIKTPEKVLDCLTKLIPLFKYHSPPSFIGDNERLYLNMSKSEVAVKKKMLKQFVSQHPKDLIMHFGFRDRFQPFIEHDYTAPPHNYGNSIIYKIRYGNISLLKRLFRRPYWKFKTIHTKKKREHLHSLFPR